MKKFLETAKRIIAKMKVAANQRIMLIFSDEETLPKVKVRERAPGELARPILYIPFGKTRRKAGLVMRSTPSTREPEFTIVSTGYTPCFERHLREDSVTLTGPDGRKRHYWSDKEWLKVKAMRENGSSYDEIASALGIARDKVVSQFARMRKKGQFKMY